MNSTILSNINRFILLVLLQVTVFSSFHILGYINPYPYILFVLLFPVNGNKSALVVSSFFLGLFIDMFLNSGGVHAAACVVVAYFRPYFFKFAFGLSYEYQTIKILGRFTKERISYLTSIILIHHLVLFSLEVFKISFFFNVLSKTVLSTIFTLLICMIIIYLIKPSKKTY
jgi:rod shape-determining protein MreD